MLCAAEVKQLITVSTLLSFDFFPAACTVVLVEHGNGNGEVKHFSITQTQVFHGQYTFLGMIWIMVQVELDGFGWTIANLNISNE